MRALNVTFKVCVILLTIGYLSNTFLIPEYVFHTNKSRYIELTLKCALAMDSNWYIEQQNNKALKKSSELQLIDCHDYDKVRKKMLASGISEHRLSSLGLLALEIHQRPAEELAIHHKFRER